MVNNPHITNKKVMNLCNLGTRVLVPKKVLVNLSAKIKINAKQNETMRGFQSDPKY